MCRKLRENIDCYCIWLSLSFFFSSKFQLFVDVEKLFQSFFKAFHQKTFIEKEKKAWKFLSMYLLTQTKTKKKGQKSPPPFPRRHGKQKSFTLWKLMKRFYYWLIIVFSNWIVVKVETWKRFCFIFNDEMWGKSFDDN